MNQHAKDFINVLDHLKPSRHRHDVFSDWLGMASATLYSWKKNETVEKEYLEIAKNYSTEEMEKHARLLAITVQALEDIGDGGDFLGDVFTTGELANSRNGQFFTPYHVSHMMAEMSIGETEFPKGRVCKVNDPCCGAGGMLIAGAMVMKERGLNYQHDAFFVGQDIDARCCRMAFIQLSLLAIPALIICGNSLSMEIHWKRETIGYHLSGIDCRLHAETLLDKLKELETTPVRESGEDKPKQAVINLPPAREYAQGELFAEAVG